MASSLVRMQTFDCAAGDTVVLSVTDAILSAPFFRRDGDAWVDATGDYDLSLSDDNEHMTFTNRRTFAATFAYRYVAASLFARLGG